MVKVIYHPEYLNYSFGKNHPFWPQRAKLFIKLLKQKKFPFELIDAQRATDEDILLAHTKDYLSKLKKMVKAGGGFLSVDTPVDKKNLKAAYYYVDGTIKACEFALDNNLIINILGGLHHAASNYSSGFCIFNDHAIAIKKLQQQEKIATAAVLDLDVHAGNGTQEIFYSDPTVLTVSLHQDSTNFYPETGFAEQTGTGKGKGLNINIPLLPGTTEKEYLPVVDRAIEKIIAFKPELVVVILGVDTYKYDPLASFQLEKETYGKIAQKLKVLTNKCVLFAGGYSKAVPQLWYNFASNLCVSLY